MRNCTRRIIQLEGRAVWVGTGVLHDPFPGDLGIEVVVSPGAELGVVLHEFGHAILSLLVGVEHDLPMFWSEGFAEYTAEQLDPERRIWPYRAYARLAAGDLGEGALSEALVGSPVYDPLLSSQLIAFLLEDLGRERLLAFLQTLAEAPSPAAAFEDALGLDPGELLDHWLEWLAGVEVTEAAETWWFAQKAKLAQRVWYLLPLAGQVRARWAVGILNRLPSQGTWHDLQLVYSLLTDPVREVVTRDLAEELLQLLPQLGKERGAHKAEILRITREFKEAMDAGDHHACIDLYLQAMTAALGPLPPLPGG